MSTEIILLSLAAFVAGFVDAIVGGGGLIQIPLGLVLFPHVPVATVIGTTKIPSFTGTSVAAIRYALKIKLNYWHLLVMASLAGTSAFLGSTLLTHVSNTFMKPLLLVVLACVAVYTYLNKDFGLHSEKGHSAKQHIVYASIISVIIGFYDGFIGPGTGSFLMLAFVAFLGHNFLRASAMAKFVNLSTNIGSIILFATSGHIMYEVALPMAVCNGLGGFLGSRFAILKGNAVIRIFFLIVIGATMLRFAWDVV